MLEQAFVDLKEAWAPVLPVEFEYLDSEVNPALASIVSPSEVVVVCSFTIELDGGGGQLHVTMPYSMIEPIRDRLDAGVQSDRDDIDERWTQALREEIMTAEVELDATLVEKKMTLRDIMALEPGDIIPVELPEKVVVNAGGLPTFRARYGVSRGKMALKILESISREHILRNTTGESYE